MPMARFIQMYEVQIEEGKDKQPENIIMSLARKAAEA